MILPLGLPVENAIPMKSPDPLLGQSVHRTAEHIGMLIATEVNKNMALTVVVNGDRKRGIFALHVYISVVPPCCNPAALS